MEMEVMEESGKMENMETDTSDTFAEVFGSRTEFDSWDEFTTLMEDFQRKSRSSFKLKSASSVDYINEKRVHDFIPERFVYAKVKMICVHFGLPTIRGNGHRKDYLGKGCGAFMNIGYKKGCLKLSQTCLKHINHPLGQEGVNVPLRQFRVFNFTDEIDLIIAREVFKHNPFVHINGDKKWSQIINNLKERDERLITINSRLVKRRIRLLIDKFLVISNGNPPVAKDEMGNILYGLEKTRKEKLNNSARRQRGRKKKNSSYSEDNDDICDDDDFPEDMSPNRRRSDDGQNHHGSVRRGERVRRSSQKRKSSLGYEEEDQPVDLSSDNELLDPGYSTKRNTTPVRRKARIGRPPKKIAASLPEHADGSDDGVSSAPKRSAGELNMLVNYLQRKDQQDRKLRQQEIDLRKEELAILKRDMELRRQQQEMDKTERKGLLDLLKSQTQALENCASSHKSSNSLTESSSPMAECTILVENK